MNRKIEKHPASSPHSSTHCVLALVLHEKHNLMHEIPAARLIRSPIKLLSRLLSIGCLHSNEGFDYIQLPPAGFLTTGTQVFKILEIPLLFHDRGNLVSKCYKKAY